MKTIKNLIVTLAVSMMVVQAQADNHALSTKVRALTGEDGMTEVVTNEWMSVPAAADLRLVVTSRYAVIANVGVRLFKQSTSDLMEQVGSGEVLHFSDGPGRSKAFSLEAGSNYVLAFQGQIFGGPVATSAGPLDPMAFSVRIEDQDGRAIIDFGDIPVQYAGKFLKYIANTSAYEVVDGVLNLSSTSINGSLYLKAVSKK